ncbi:DEAD-box ATP-dependent RNA helicase 38 [Beta vulgaris subsp. vulgaris]|uniref:DEAD-box ATP-dependent RNA helicase 38 n=1 Tax=Beta vulgaris subsp. vulgaris TaxID=3555 RepID=UPI00203689A7|nr:DEAD-box ATP-dependent RNA helicase 38 [Beta vulgaris subsp. vulgaris]
MADTTEATITIPSTEPETSSTTSTSLEISLPEIKSPEIKPPEIKRSWGDEVDDEEFTIDQLSIKERKDLDEPEDSNIQAVTTGDTPYTSAKKFEDLNLSEELLKGLYVEMRFERPSKIQAVTLPMILTPPYKNLIAQAHNGSGKTTCFNLGMLSRVDPKQRVPQAICICPTRELAIQNLEVLMKMGKFTGITAERAVAENLDNPAHISIYKRPPITSQVIIGTPGTIKKWVSTKKLSLVHMKILVFDEADHMLAEDGFRDDSLKIMNDIKRSAPKCQVLLFSATFSERVKNFITRTITDYNQLFVKKEELSLDSVKQYKVRCPDELAKVTVVKEKVLELGQKLGQSIIFVRSKNSASYLHRALVDMGYEVTTIQGALTHDDRDKIVKEFKDGLTKVLISTDLLARGFDQSQVNLVVNYDLPVKHDARTEPDCEVYLHRVGRAGRFGRKGAVFNLICDERENMVMEKIENHFGTKVVEVPSLSDEDFEAALREAGLL